MLQWREKEPGAHRILPEDLPAAEEPRARLVQSAKTFITDIEGGKSVEKSWSRHAREAGKHLDSNDDELVTIKLSDVEPQPVEWLWEGRFALGKLSLLCGDPGLGKSTVGVDVMARVTRGFPFPGGAPASEPGDVLILSAEDDPADTIRPRLDAAGGDSDRVIVLKAVRERDPNSGKRTERGISLTRDIARIEDQLRKNPSIRAIKIDPLSAYLGVGTDSYRDSEVRAVLAPLADLAAKYGVAVIVIVHLNKAGGTKAIYRAQGSMGFVAAVRTAWAIGRDKDDKTLCYVAQVKNNLGPDPGTLAYRIEEVTLECGVRVGRVDWQEGTVDMSADDVLDDARPDRGPSKVEGAVAWLEGYLAEGPVESTRLLADAQSEGHKKRTLERASEDRRVVKRPAGFGGQWVWSLPGADHEPQSPPTEEEGGGLCESEVSPQSPPAIPTPELLADSDEVGGLWKEEAGGDGTDTESARFPIVRQRSGSGGGLADSGGPSPAEGERDAIESPASSTPGPASDSQEKPS